MESSAPIPGYCILKCMQILYDNKCCSICKIDTNFWEKLMENKHIPSEKSELDLCLGKNN